jgi:hypothetical protein
MPTFIQQNLSAFLAKKIEYLFKKIKIKQSPYKS